MNNQLLVSQWFTDSIADLPQEIDRQIEKTLRNLAQDPFHRALRTKRLEQFGGRRIFSARINRRLRLLWEQEGRSRIVLWKLCHHDDADTRRWLPNVDTQKWQLWNPKEQQQ